MSSWVGFAFLATALGQAPGPAGGRAPAATAADQVVLRDGQVALGQVIEPAPRGKVLLVVRRDWARAHVPDWAKRWESAEQGWAPRARRERRERLQAWRRERAAAGLAAGGTDRLREWLDREIDRLADRPDAPPSPLLAVQIARSDVRSTRRQPPETSRLLRLAWQGHLEAAESMPLDDLKQALEGRGFPIRGQEPVSLDALLPIMPEPEGRWLARRAATELAHDSGLRFIRHAGTVLSEDSQGVLAAPAALAAGLKDLLDDKPPQDPMAATFRSVAARGRVGLVVTELGLPADLSSVSVESTLWIRQTRDRWVPAVKHAATVRPEEVANQAADALGNDPQVEAAFRLVESLGLGQVAADLRQRSLKMGAATQRGLAQVRAALDRDLEVLELPTETTASDAPARTAEPAGSAASPRNRSDLSRPNEPAKNGPERR